MNMQTASAATAAQSAQHSATLNPDPLLQIHNLESYYGPIRAIQGISFSVQQGQVVSVLGANGAGKTTLMKTLSGVMDPEKGSIKLRGVEIQGREPDHIVRQGIIHVPEGREVFPLLSVEDNLKMGAYTRSNKAEINADLEMVYDYFPILKERRQQDAAMLSGGQQQMLAIGRGLMAKPTIMLLDEPSLGLSPLLVQEIFGIVKRLNQEQKVTLLIVEQNAKVALDVADQGYVLELGRIVMAGSAGELKASKDIQEFYLGVQEQSERGKRRWKKRKTWR